MAKVIMVQGTMSNAGKSLLVAGLCRIFRQDGYRVAPFKSQNMALNSFITEDGLEMGRAQVMQAEAAGIQPDVCMNPILLKPTNNIGSQVIVNGEVMGNMKATKYFQYKKQLVPEIIKAFKKLEAMADIIVIEGAGSPAEINLKENDIVNMGMAELVDASVLLVGDIDRGGVFAQLLGTVSLLEEKELERVKGLVINKFRGDKTILDPGIEMLEEKGGIPVTGVIPYMELKLEDEDSLTERFDKKEEGLIDLAVIRYPRISNFTDFNVFEQMDGVTVRYVTKAEELHCPDMIFLPGSKNTMGDLIWMRQSGMEAAIKKCVGHIPIFGICGGYQMLGNQIADEDGVEEGGTIRGMELLPITTHIKSQKVRRQVRGIIENAQGIFEKLSGKEYLGYEIHMGDTVYDDGENADFEVGLLTIMQSGDVYGTYIHGIFDQAEIAQVIVNALAERKGITIENGLFMNYQDFKEQEYDKLAETVREYMDMDAVYGMLREVRYPDATYNEKETNLQNMMKIEDIMHGSLKLNGPDQKIYTQIKNNWDMLAKPLDSLGVFEETTAHMGAILRSTDLRFEKKAIIAMCADNGVVEEGISQSGQEVTLAVAKAMGEKKSSVCKMAAVNGMDVIPIDIGINSSENIPGVLSRKVCQGTRNFAKEPAMTREETLQAIQVGMDIVADCKEKGYTLLGTGEMGIGNTTTSCAVAAALLGCEAKKIVGRGAGLSNEGLLKKEQVIQSALQKYDLYQKDALTALSSVGGLDIAGLTGIMIGGACYHIPIILDGVITAVAALVAVRMFPEVREYLIASHVGKEPAIAMILKELELRAVIDANLALGEGTGAVMFCSLLDTALALYTEQTTFEDMKIEAYQRFDIDK